MATANPTGADARPKNLSVRRDQVLDEALAVLTSTGMTASDAVRLAVTFLAHGYRDLWDHGVLPEGVAPRVIGMRTQLPDAPEAVTSGYGARPTPPTGPGDRTQQAPHARPTLPLAS
ncbi:hypothetical protein [Streptomyces vinaceus]|uniref:hypothetical protein n=1 Tax=Streptomyces vinaceus TaxID=1960 RepID=UPI0038052F14